MPAEDLEHQGDDSFALALMVEGDLKMKCFASGADLDNLAEFFNIDITEIELTYCVVETIEKVAVVVGGNWQTCFRTKGPRRLD